MDPFGEQRFIGGGGGGQGGDADLVVAADFARTYAKFGFEGAGKARAGAKSQFMRHFADLQMGIFGCAQLDQRLAQPAVEGEPGDPAKWLKHSVD